MEEKKDFDVVSVNSRELDEMFSSGDGEDLSEELSKVLNGDSSSEEKSGEFDERVSEKKEGSNFASSSVEVEEEDSSKKKVAPVVFGVEQGRFDKSPTSLTEVDRQTLEDIKDMFIYLDGLLGDLPKEKIEGFSLSVQYDKYLELFKKLGIVSVSSKQE